MAKSCHMIGHYKLLSEDDKAEVIETCLIGCLSNYHPGGYISGNMGQSNLLPGMHFCFIYRTTF